jgi:predicted AAA+ superfamily ATPase
LQKWNPIPNLHIFTKIEFMIPRAILPQAQLYLSQFRAVCITGPGQSGKTTLSKMLFKKYPYVNFENPDTQAKAEENPAAFLQNYTNGAIFDEVQRIRVLFRYLQEILDNNLSRGQFILTGSNHFLLQEQMYQSLAGRAGYLTLLPLSYAELSQTHAFKQKNHTLQQLILTGGYPEIWHEQLQHHIWLAAYFQTYVQRDVRLLKNIGNLAAFTKLIYLCAAHAGKLLNRETFASAIGVDNKTIQYWLGLLETSFIIYLLPPWHNNTGKRIIKSPKLYFYDTGLLRYLLNIKTTTQLQQHLAYGAIVENWVISEIKKNRLNEGFPDNLHFYRDSAGNEVDIVFEKNGIDVAIEIKGSKKWDNGMLRGLHYWDKYHPHAQKLLTYAGEESRMITDQLQVASWTTIGDI